MKYGCTIPFSATRYVEVEANSPEEAADEAQAQAAGVSLCHACSRKIEVGEPLGAYVSDADSGDELLDTTWQSERIRLLESELAELKAERAACDTTKGADHG